LFFRRVWYYIVCRLVRCCLISRLVSVFVWYLLKYQLQSITKSINDLDDNVAYRKHGCSRHMDFVMLFVGILLLYAINLGVEFFSPYIHSFLAMLNMWLYLMYSINLNEWISFCFYKKKRINNEVYFFSYDMFFSKT